MPVATREMTLPSPFKDENRLILIIPKTTTKYTGRSAQMYADIARYVSDIAEAVPGNTIAFFPSYDILAAVKNSLLPLVTRPVLEETPGLSKENREALLTAFKGHAVTGSLLLAVTAGSFSEGVDLPGDLLKAVIIVGIPLAKPTKEIEALIAYYDRKYGRGWDYGYTFPAFNKVLQSAGRPIRTMTDRGLIVFLDERFATPQYARLLPPEWKPKTTLLYKKAIADFFAGSPAPKSSLTQEFAEESEGFGGFPGSFPQDEK
jgi:Rad3-related DNA helicase